MTVIYNAQDERDFHDHDRTPDSRCSTCWGPLSYPYAYWTLSGVQPVDGGWATMFFCNRCCGRAMAQDLADLARDKRIKEARRELCSPMVMQ